MDININKVKSCYNRFKANQNYYRKIDKYYFGNTDELKHSLNLPNRSNARVKTNFVQKLVDEEALYSFGNKVTFKAIDERHKQALQLISYHFKNNGAGYNNQAGKRLVEFQLGYELNYITGDNKFKSKYITPLEGDVWLNEYDEVEFFIYVHTKTNDKGMREDCIDVYDDKYVYYFDSSFNEINPAKAHNIGCVPVGFGMVDGVRYTTRNGYIEGDKSIYRTIKTLQDALEQNFSDITQEITDFHNAILKFYGIDLEDMTDSEGKVITDNEGRALKKEPILGQNSVLYFGDKDKEGAEWLIKNINDTFIKNTRDDLKDYIYTLTSHIDSNEKMQSNLSGVALRSKLRTLEAKCKANENAMEDIIRHRIKCLFNWLRLTNIGDYDENMISIEFTPCVPEDLSLIADVITKLPHEILSNETKRSMLSNVYGNIENEQERIDREKKAMMDFEMDLDKEVGEIDETDTGATIVEGNNGEAE